MTLSIQLPVTLILYHKPDIVAFSLINCSNKSQCKHKNQQSILWRGYYCPQDTTLNWTISDNQPFQFISELECHSWTKHCHRLSISSLPFPATLSISKISWFWWKTINSVSPSVDALWPVIFPALFVCCSLYLERSFTQCGHAPNSHYIFKEKQTGINYFSLYIFEIIGLTS